VLDLGCFPGSWTLYAAKRVGEKGRVVGVDLHAPTVPLPSHVEILVRDVSMLAAESLGKDRFSVVLSDLAPATTGQRNLDQYRSFALFERALEIASAVLREGGR